MALQENDSELKFSFALMKNFLHQLRHLFVNSKTLLFMSALTASYLIVEFSVFSTIMDYYADSKVVEDLPISAILTNLQDGLSSLLFIFASLISEVYTSPVTMITICAAVTIEMFMPPFNGDDLVKWITLKESISKYKIYWKEQPSTCSISFTKQSIIRVGRS
ncbi:hypothetical protein PHAVU_010G003900, partial [Phaseolus vulgaris]|uniref:Uncharacterized protein n=1 Tax=Phaseolus vulgaris TaxID=3885 RepID=V7AK51_PHAVU|nr:hypothetical protein PHAVU_010G003900g [Phaseolus vulgaris]ESW05919.1 hypothetical protein PHAVU_010G003900g [Phaseolus vulgaris]